MNQYSSFLKSYQLWLIILQDEQSHNIHRLCCGSRLRLAEHIYNCWLDRHVWLVRCTRSLYGIRYILHVNCYMSVHCVHTMNVCNDHILMILIVILVLCDCILLLLFLNNIVLLIYHICFISHTWMLSERSNLSDSDHWSYLYLMLFEIVLLLCNVLYRLQLSTLVEETSSIEKEPLSVAQEDTYS